MRIFVPHQNLTFGRQENMQATKGKQRKVKGRLKTTVQQDVLSECVSLLDPHLQIPLQHEVHQYQRLRYVLHWLWPITALSSLDPMI